MALAPVAGGDTAENPYVPVGVQRTTRYNNDGTLTPIVNITAQSARYGVQFTFTILASTYVDDGGPPLTAEKAGQVDEICAHDHVQGFYTEQDQGPDQILYNYAVITVGSDDGAFADYVSARMDGIGDAQVFTDIDQVWTRLTKLGAT